MMLSADTVSVGWGPGRGRSANLELDGWCGPPLVWAGWTRRGEAGYGLLREWEGMGQGCVKEERPHLSEARGTGTSTLRVI